MTSFAEFTKKKKKQSLTGVSFEEYTESLLGIDIEDIAPIRTVSSPINWMIVFMRIIL